MEFTLQPYLITVTVTKIKRSVMEREASNERIIKQSFDREYLSNSLNFPSIIAGTCPIGFISEKSI